MISSPSPVVVTVEHGLPYRLIAVLGANEIVAGGATSVQCRAEDKHGNEITDLPMSVHLPPNLEMKGGFGVGGTISGTYFVKCVPVGLPWSAFAIEESILEVLPGPPINLDLMVQLGVHNEVRRATEIVQISRVAQGQKVRYQTVWQLDPNTTAEEPTWIRLPVEEQSQ